MDGVDVGLSVAVGLSFSPELQPADEVRRTDKKTNSTPSEKKTFFNALPKYL